MSEYTASPPERVALSPTGVPLSIGRSSAVTSASSPLTLGRVVHCSAASRDLVMTCLGERQQAPIQGFVGFSRDGS